MPKKLLVIGGYSKAGKTSSINYLENVHGAVVVSTSAMLHAVSSKLNGWNSYDIDKSHPISINGVKYPTYRDYLIWLAEEVLVPIFGREIFGITAANKAVRGLEDNDLVVVESVGGEEYEFFEKHLSFIDTSDATKVNINVVREGRNGGDDLRVPLPDAATLTNDSTREDLGECLDYTLDLINKLYV